MVITKTYKFIEIIQDHRNRHTQYPPWPYFTLEKRYCGVHQYVSYSLLYKFHNVMCDQPWFHTYPSLDSRPIIR